MLQRILTYLRDNETVTSKDIAKALDIDQDTLQGMLEELERLGYISSNSPECDKNCAGCPYACPDPEELVTVWTLKEKNHS
jgi:predicted ArsR family transcriptional regulator